MSDLRALIGRVEAGPDSPGSNEWWRIANSDAQIGDRVYVFKQGTKSPRGVFGVGEIVGRPERGSTPTDSEMHLRVNVRFQKLVDPTAGLLLQLAEVEDFVPPNLINAQRSGRRVPEEVASELERRLAAALRAGAATIGSDPAYDPASATDEHERAMRAICIRRGQPASRAALLVADRVLRRDGPPGTSSRPSSATRSIRTPSGSRSPSACAPKRIAGPAKSSPPPARREIPHRTPPPVWQRRSFRP